MEVRSSRIICLEHKRVVEALIKQADSSAQHSMGATLGRLSWSPGEGESRSKVRPVLQVSLRFVTDTATEKKVRSDVPVILYIRPHVALLNLCQRVAAAHGKAGRAPAQQPDCGRGHSLSFKKHRSPIPFERSQRDWNHLTLRILHRYVVDIEFRPGSRGEKISSRRILFASLVAMITPHAYSCPDGG